MNLHMKSTILFCSLFIGYASHAWADATLMDMKQLQHALSANPPCCVIDGRSNDSRKKHSLDDALPYKEDLRINPTSTIVVIADDDAKALKIAGTLANAYPGQRILAVKGGVETWEATQMELSRVAASGPPSGIGFVIPKNTCESGSPLQQLRSKFK